MKKLLYILFSTSLISNAACVYRTIVNTSTFLKTSAIQAKYSKEAQIWYHEQFLKLSKTDKDFARKSFQEIINNSKKRFIGLYPSIFNERTTKFFGLINKKFDFSKPQDNESFESLYNLAKETLTQYNDDKSFGLRFSANLVYPLLNRNLAHAINKINDACNETFDKKFAEFKLEKNFESLKEFNNLCTQYFTYLQSFVEIMNEV